MEDIRYLIIVVVAIFVIGLVIYLISSRNNKNNSLIGEANGSNKRSNFRLDIDIEDAVMEIVKIGDVYVNRRQKCEIIDLSVSGMGINSYMDYSTNKPIFVRVSFKLNGKEFSIEGEIVRKSKDRFKPVFFYGINFTNLLPGDEYKLIKEIFSINNSRRSKVTIK
jgi:c-di-GMP-binding flagellar brake protein YcgR